MTNKTIKYLHNQDVNTCCRFFFVFLKSKNKPNKILKIRLIEIFDLLVFSDFYIFKYKYRFLLIISGRPRPYVFWRKGASVIQGSITIDDNGIVRNELVFERLKREDLLTVLTCQASNNNFTSAVYASVTIDLNRKYTYMCRHDMSLASSLPY